MARVWRSMDARNADELSANLYGSAADAEAYVDD